MGCAQSAKHVGRPAWEQLFTVCCSGQVSLHRTQVPLGVAQADGGVFATRAEHVRVTVLSREACHGQGVVHGAESNLPSSFDSCGCTGRRANINEGVFEALTPRFPIGIVVVRGGGSAG